MSRRMVEIYIFCMKNKLSDNGSRKNLWQFGMEQEEDFSGVLHCLKKMVFEGELRLMFICALFLFIYCAITTLIFENTFQHFFCLWQSLGKCKSTTTILSKPFFGVTRISDEAAISSFSFYSNDPSVWEYNFWKVFAVLLINAKRYSWSFQKLTRSPDTFQAQEILSMHKKELFLSPSKGKIHNATWAP